VIHIFKIFHQDSFSFVDGGSFKHPQKIYNVVPGDFTHSGKLDILVMSQSQSNNQLDLTLYPALAGDGFGELLHPWTRNGHSMTPDINNPMTLPSSTPSQPIPLDVDGDMKIDLLGITPGSLDGSNPTFQLWQNVWNASAPDSKLFTM